MLRFIPALGLLLAGAFALRAADDALEAQMKAAIGAYAIIERNAADPVDPDRVFYRARFPACCAVSIPIPSFSIPTSLNNCGRWKRPRRKDSAAWFPSCRDA